MPWALTAQGLGGSRSAPYCGPWMDHWDGVWAWPMRSTTGGDRSCLQLVNIPKKSGSNRGRFRVSWDISALTSTHPGDAMLEGQTPMPQSLLIHLVTGWILMILLAWLQALPPGRGGLGGRSSSQGASVSGASVSSLRASLATSHGALHIEPTFAQANALLNTESGKAGHGHF